MEGFAWLTQGRERVGGFHLDPDVLLFVPETEQTLANLLTQVPNLLWIPIDASIKAARLGELPGSSNCLRLEMVTPRLYAFLKAFGSDPESGQENSPVNRPEDRIKQHSLWSEWVESLPRKVPVGAIQAKNLILGRYDQELAIADLSEVSGLSPSHLSRVFSNRFGQPPHKLLTGRRLQVARRILTERPRILIAKCCEEVGFKDPSSFIRLFRREFGFTPKASSPHGSPQIQLRAGQ